MKRILLASASALTLFAIAGCDGGGEPPPQGGTGMEPAPTETAPQTGTGMGTAPQTGTGMDQTAPDQPATGTSQ